MISVNKLAYIIAQSLVMEFRERTRSSSTTDSLLSYCMCLQVCLSVGIIIIIVILLFFMKNLSLKCIFCVPWVCRVILMREYKCCVTCNISAFHLRHVCDC